MTIRDQLLEFHHAVGQPIVEKPTIPSRDRMRLRLHLITEEVLELLEAGSLDVDKLRKEIADMIDAVYATPRQEGMPPVIIDFPKMVDALADIDYVVEGTRLEFGVNGGPIAEEVHRANMMKADGPMRPDGKRLKPPGWLPPNIEGELRKQGWEP